MTVADALELSALSDHVRVRIAKEIRCAYLSAFSKALEHDADASVNWDMIIEQQADKYHTSQVQPVFSVDVLQVQDCDAYSGGVL